MTGPEGPRFLAVVEMVGRTGCAEFQLRYSDDEEPVVWMAVARYRRGPDGRPQAAGPINSFDAGAGPGPYEAVCRLLNQIVDGGTCTHCGRSTGFSPDPDHLPMGDWVCWYQYDPSTRRIAKGCVASEEA